MKTDLLMNFSVDKENNTITVDREFAASQDKVWTAWTTAEMLDQWWAPKPLTSRTKEMDFKVGGKRFYAMVTPEGQERWILQEYRSITPKSNFTLFNAFADEDQNAELPGSDWDLNFTEKNGKTTVHISIYNESLERLERMIEFGFKEGTAAQLSNLEELLANLQEPNTSVQEPNT